MKIFSKNKKKGKKDEEAENSKDGQMEDEIEEWVDLK